MNEPWNILLVDDEPDVHEITRLALKHKRWRKRPFALTSLSSMREAVAFLESGKARDVQVAIVDVVMETNDAGLRLCEYMRRHCQSSLRIVLRTGQPGSAPEEHVLNEYDIDYYLAKSEATPEKLFSVVRACLRSSQDISTLLAFGRQLQSFTRALQDVSSVKDLLVFMGEALQFLELKHSAQTVFNYDLNAPAGHYITPRLVDRDLTRIHEGMVKAFNVRAETKVHEGRSLGLSDNSFIIPFEGQQQQQGDKPAEEGDNVPGALYFEIAPEVLSDKAKRDLEADASLFIDNWRIAYATLRLQERFARERMLREKMYYERVQSVATMVTGVAHELNTPLGVANTANAMVTSLAQQLSRLPPGAPEGPEISRDLDESCALLTKNLARAQTLIRSFKQLSASQLSDQRGQFNLTEVVKDCVESMTPDSKKHQIQVVVTAPPGEVPWDGYPSHLSQVVMNMIQNVIRYAYPQGGPGGKFDIRISQVGEIYRIEFEDYGAGVNEDIMKNLFEPFVTSARGKGGTGLGLAIVHNIVTNLLDGTIKCTSVKGKGTKFTVDIPLVVKEKTNEQRAPLASVPGFAA